MVREDMASDDIFYGDDDGKKGEGDPGPLPTHCNVPLKYSKQRAALGIPAPGQYVGKRDFNKIEWEAIKRLTGDHEVRWIDSAHIQGYLLGELELEDNLIVNLEFEQQLRIGGEQFFLQSQPVSQLVNPPLDPSFVEFSEEEKTFLKKHYLLRTLFEEGVLTSGSRNFKPTLWWKKTGDVSYFKMMGVNMYVTKNLWFVQTPLGNALLSRDHLLIFSDMVSQRYLLRQIAILEEKNDRVNFLSLHDLELLLANGDSMLEFAGNAAYKVVYSLEPSCLSRLIGDIPVGTATSRTFREILMSDITEHAENMKILPLLRQRESILDSLGNATQITQAFGLYRIWGHPTIEPLAGVSALKKIATKVRGFKPKFVEQIELKFKEEFIMRYIAKEGRWPTLDVSRLSNLNPIKTAYEFNSLYPISHKFYDRVSLKLVDFGKTFLIDPKFDIVEMLADKSLSLFTPELKKKLVSGKGTGKSKERSVLIEWMKSNLHDPEEFLRKIDTEGFKENEVSLGVREKEREGKLMARLFGLMTLTKRTYIVLTEALLAEHIMEYFPEITMTDDELSLDKKRLDFTDVSLASRSLFTSLDFSKWNSNMREEETKPIFQCFDHLFGLTNCYQRTHEMFKNSFIYLLNGSYTPKLVGGQFVADIGSWYGHLGGIEGLRQKGWTIWTVILILLAAEDFPIKLRLMGQGDNQVLREIFPEEISQEEQMNLHYKFLARMNEILSEVGPPLKMEETWTSRDLFIYGKYLIYKGSPISMFGKRMCRMFRLSNEDYPTLESTISSLTANYSAALSCSYDHSYLYYLYTTEVIGALQLFFRTSYLQPASPSRVLSSPFTVIIKGMKRIYERRVSKLLDKRNIQSDWIYHGLMLFPRCLGGFPITLLGSSLIRGFPDEVSLNVSILRMIYPHSNSKIQEMITNFICPPKHNDFNYVLILEHPTALNLDAPSAPSEARRSLVVDYLKHCPYVKNPSLSSFISVLDDPRAKKIYEYLASATPFAPRVLSSIVGSTVDARARQVAGKLQKSATISELARTEGEKDLYTTIAESELNHAANVLRLLVTKTPSLVTWNPNKCSVQHSEDLRKYSWGKTVVGVDCVPPFEFMLIENKLPSSPCLSSVESDKGKILIRISGASTHADLQDPMVRGQYRAYRGSVTRQKVSGYGDKLATVSNPVVRNALKLFTLIGWSIKAGGNLHSLVEMIKSSVTDLDSELLYTCHYLGSGSPQHRHQDMRTAHGGAVPILPNYGSKFGFDTFPLVAYSKGSSNVNLMFQSIMSLTTVLMGPLLLQSQELRPESFHIHVKNSCCIRPVNEEQIDCPSIPPLCIVSHKDSEYLYVKSDKILPPNFKQSVRLSKLKSTQDPEESSLRLYNLICDNMMAILNPSAWSRFSDPSHAQLTINWVLKVEFRKVMEYLAFYFLVYFSSEADSSDRKSYLLKIADAVARSPKRAWESLEALIHSPTIARDISGSPYHAQISGNPCMSESILAGNLRSYCYAVLITWANDVEERASVNLLQIRAQLVGSFTCHPALCLAFQNWLLNDDLFAFTNLRKSLIYAIKRDVSSPCSLTPLIQSWVSAAESITHPDPIDNVAKTSPSITISSVIPLTEIHLPSATTVLLSFNRSDLTKTIMDLGSVDTVSSRVVYSSREREIASPTTGNYKGLSLVERLHLKDPKLVACLGDGSGGFTWSVLRSHLQCKVFFNTLIDISVPIEQASAIPYIPSLTGWASMQDRVHHMEVTTDEISDITSPLFPKVVSDKCGKLDAIICDAECRSTFSSNLPQLLVDSVIKLAYETDCPFVILKTYAARPTMVRYQISVMLSYYQNVSVLRSWFSESGNTELYLLASNPGCPRVISIMDNKAHGLILAETHIATLHHLSESLQKAHNRTPIEISTTYTRVIAPDAELHTLSQIQQILPFLDEGKELTFPHSLDKWIKINAKVRDMHMIKEGADSRMASFKHNDLQRWLSAWLIVWILADFPSEQEIESVYTSAYLVWFPTMTGSWEFSVSTLLPPTESQGKELLCWKIDHLLSSMHMKIISRLVFCVSQRGYKIRTLSNGVMRGGLDIAGRKIPIADQARSIWVRQNIQCITRSNQEPRRIGQTGLTLLPLWEQVKKRHRIHH